ncbi:hypothetical protein EYM_02690 [Ignicoccus islandicus DSM 13165]|uniref:Uncharacterized protein n=1 Tax=Ignicoccus islandicus DSM 13165 TaxID=940295 RepID=A0A0U3DXX1_9CREN|nr:hypothetical protein [Ignicoccus islandicus]ALU12346.1 hypothetical protein EYM_02690 [Ignicoccus islandicus DSM 13165]
MRTLRVIEFKRNGFTFTIAGDVLIVSIRLSFDEIAIYRGPWRDLEPPPDWVREFWEGLKHLELQRYSANRLIKGWDGVSALRTNQAPIQTEL